MSDPEAPGDRPLDEASNEMTSGEGTPSGAGAPGVVPPRPSQPEPAEWWRVEPESPGRAPASRTPPSGTPPSGTPPSGAPYGTPPSGTPPYGTPPAGSPSWGGQPWGGPAWGGPPWGGPPWGGPPPWYGWGPGWPGGGPPPAGSAQPASTRHQPLPWVIVGALLAAIAMVAIGLGIGYSVWGGSASAVGRSSRSATAPHVAPATGRGGFLGVEVEPAAFAPGSTSSSTPSTPSTSSTPTTAGAYVVEVVPSSPAAKAGIVKGDTITEFATRRVLAALTLRTDVLSRSPGSRVKVGWVTSTGKHESATVTLAKRPTSSSIG